MKRLKHKQNNFKLDSVHYWQPEYITLKKTGVMCWNFLCGIQL